MAQAINHPAAGFMMKKYYKVIICSILAIVFISFDIGLLFWFFVVLAFVFWHKARQINGKQVVVKQFANKKSASWFGRHLILTAVLIVFGFVIVVNIISGIVNTPSGQNQNGSSSVPSPQFTTIVIPPTPTPRIIKKAPTPMPTARYTPPPTPVPTPVVVKSWHTVVTFSGDSTVPKNTDLFTVRGSQWRINWTALNTDSFCLSNGCYFDIYAMLPGVSFGTTMMVTAHVSGTKSDSSTFYENGTFYLQIDGLHLDSWTATVEDYY